jgi:glycosyltransferase involved in cell wall biosynthesis
MVLLASSPDMRSTPAVITSSGDTLPRGPTITIITSTLNCADALAETAGSIHSQTHPHVQWIIADGGSTDGTVDAIRKLRSPLVEWFSEPDSGIYDAWNKACQRTRGHWVLFLGAGDTLAAPDTLTRAAAALQSMPEHIVFAYGNVVQSSKGQVLYRYGEVTLGTWQLARPTLPAHQGVFHRADVLGGFAPFDISYKVVADSKLLIRVMRPEVTRYLAMDIADMQAGGVSSHPASALKVMREFLRLEADLGYRIPPLHRLSFMTRNHLKAFLVRVAGSNFVERLVHAKQRRTQRRL